MPPVMRIIDVYNFMITYLNSSLEHIYIWLRQFSLSDQVIFIKLFSTDKIKPISKYHLSLSYYDHLDHKCNCRKIWEALDDDFKQQIHLNNVLKCVDDTLTFSDKDLNNDPYETVILELERIYRFDKDKKNNNDFLIEYNPTTFIRSTTLEQQQQQQPKHDINNLFLNDQQYLKKCTDKYIFKNKHDFSLPISIIFHKLDKLHCLLPYMSIVELYTLYRIKYAFNLNDIERLLPEYWRSINRNSYENKIISPYDLLKSVYKFHNIQDIIQYDTNTKATFKLAKIIDELYFKKEYFSKEKIIITQPNFCGYRVVICKTMESGVNILNKHGFKINLSLQRNIKLNLMQDLNSSYTGEFIIMPYDPMTDVYMHHCHFFQNNIKTCKLVLVDLFLWNGINLLGKSYGTRLRLIKHFVKKVKHNNSIVQIPEIKDITRIKNAYNCELRDSIDGKTHFNGVIFRHFNVNYQKEIYRKKFCSTKCEIFTKYNIFTILVSPKKPAILSIEKYKKLKVVFKNNDYKYSIDVVCYRYIKKNTNNKISCNVLNLAIFDQYKYIPWQKIQLQGNKKIKLPYTSHKIKLNNKDHNWMIISVGFNEIENSTVPILNDIINIEIRPDKSLSDCPTLSDLQKIMLSM